MKKNKTFSTPRQFTKGLTSHNGFLKNRLTGDKINLCFWDFDGKLFFLHFCF